MHQSDTERGCDTNVCHNPFPCSVKYCKGVSPNPAAARSRCAGHSSEAVAEIFLELLCQLLLPVANLFQTAEEETQH